MRVVVCGGGIGGLAAASLARWCRTSAGAGLHVTVVERSALCHTPHREEHLGVGGGIALYRNALLCLDLLPDGMLRRLGSSSQWMAAPSYRDLHGNVLARPSPAFDARFPVMTLLRSDLLQELHRSCTQHFSAHPEVPPVELRTGVGVEDFRLPAGGGVEVVLTSGDAISADMLVGADGIHSAVRTQLLRKCGRPPVVPTPCGYTYYRACVPFHHMGGDVDVARWRAESFEAWGRHGVRFGMVPLREHLFWFVSVPAARVPAHSWSGAQTHTLCEEAKEWLLSTVESAFVCRSAAWNGVDVVRLVQVSPAAAVLCTAIHKIDFARHLPWSSRDGRVVLLGDAVHATAPNLAQGAGLAIEDAATLVHSLAQLDRPPHKGCLAQLAADYQSARVPRALRVQRLADCVARVGGTQIAWAARVRDSFMRNSARMFPTMQQAIMERVVLHSLSAQGSQSAWLPPAVPMVSEQPLSLLHNPTLRASVRRSILGQALPCGRHQNKALPCGRQNSVVSDDISLSLLPHHATLIPPHVWAFKSSETGGSGTGVITIECAPTAAARVLSRWAGLPQPQQNSPFDASTTNVVHSGALPSQDRCERWIRRFGVGGSGGSTYETLHGVRRGGAGSVQVFLTETAGTSLLHRHFQFAYRTHIHIDDTTGAVSVHYESVAVVVAGVWLRLPRALMPTSRWTETPFGAAHPTRDCGAAQMTAAPKGWRFEGEVSVPVVGCLMRYSGHVNT